MIVPLMVQTHLFLDPVVLGIEYCRELDSSISHSLEQDKIETVTGSCCSPSTFHEPSGKRIDEHVYNKLKTDRHPLEFLRIKSNMEKW